MRAYRASFNAITGLKSLVLQLGITCDMRDKDSLYLAAGDTAAELVAEHELRLRAGLPGNFLDHARLLETFGITRAGAILSPGAADADPMQLARGLLRVAISRGARLFDAEVSQFDAGARCICAGLADGYEIEARSVVLATGYVMPKIVHSTVQTVSSSWAIATPPQPAERLEERSADLGKQQGLSVCSHDPGRPYHHRRRGQRGRCRARSARPADSGEVCHPGKKTCSTVAPGQYRD